MQLSNIPGKLVLPFANAGGKSTIPVASQIGITAGAASLTDGFPPLTRTPIAAGGVPPSGLDMNGILYEMSAIIRWANAGGGYPFDGTFAADTNVGGYPKGARVMRSDGTGYWFNTVENNVTDPEGSGAAAAGWVPDFTTGVAAVTMTSANVTLTPAQYGKPTIVITGTLTANLNLIFPAIEKMWTVMNNTAGAFTIMAKTASGTGSVIAQGFVGQINGDGTNIYSRAADFSNTTDMSKGVALIGGAGRVIDTIAALKTLPKTGSPRAFVTGYYAAGDGGGGTYWYDLTDTTSADNGGSIIVAADGGRWKLVQTTPQTLKQFGAKCDGITNDSVSAQAWIDANKGKRIIHTAGVALIAGVTLSGVAYDSTEIICIGGEFKLKADGGASTFGGAWVGLLVKDCNQVYLDLEWDGNRTAMTATREQIFCVGLAGAQDMTIPSLRFREVQGDGLFVGQSDWLANSNPSRRLNIGTVSGTNSTNSGRNLVSIISVAVCNIDSVESYQIGGVINGVRQPGGIDIEPDFGYQLCEDITIGNINVVTAGTTGLGVFGKAATNDATGDWTTQRIAISNFLIRLTNAGSGGVNFIRVFDLNVKGSVSFDIGVRAKGCVIDFASRVKADIKTQGCTYGVNVAAGGTVSDFEINILSNDYSGAGLRTTDVRRGKFTGRCGGSPGGSTSFGVQTHNEGRGSITQTSVVYEIDCPYDNVMARAFRNEPGNSVSYSNTYVRNCDWSGYSSPSVTNDAQIYVENVRGLTDQASIPTNGSWAASTFVKNRTPSVAAGKTTLGWSRLTTGTGNVSGTDWTPCVVTNA